MEYLFNPLFLVIAGLAVCIGVFLALREVALWYFRINQIADNIAVIADHYRAQKQVASVPVAQPLPPKFHPQTGQPLP